VTEPFQIIVYATQSGREPFGRWLDSLDGSVKGRVLARLDRLQVGYIGNAKALKDGLYELKFKNPPFRVYYAMVGKNILLLISGGDKSLQSEDIRLAKNYLIDYRSRYGKKE
jgi:putative addiction module killer protein